MRKPFWIINYGKIGWGLEKDVMGQPEYNVKLGKPFVAKMFGEEKYEIPSVVKCKKEVIQVIEKLGFKL